jgi:four helix bundle protein
VRSDDSACIVLVTRFPGAGDFCCMRPIESLRVYVAARTFAGLVHAFLLNARVPLEDVVQLRKSAKSIGDNIAEGYGYGPGNNRRRIYRIARGSAHESINQLTNFFQEGRIAKREYYRMFNLGRVNIAMLTRLVGKD